MAAKILALFALLALSASATTAQLSWLPLPPTVTDIPAILPSYAVVPCVQYATLQQVLATTPGISAASAIALQQPLNFYRQQCLTHLAVRGASSLPQLSSPAVQQQIIQQQLLPALLAQAAQQQLQQQEAWAVVQQHVALQQLVPILLQQAQQQQQVLPILLQQVQQQVLLPYLLSIVAATNANPAAAYNYALQIPYYSSLNAAATNPAAAAAAAFFAQPQQQLIESILNQAAFGEISSPYFSFNPLATASPAAYYYAQQDPFFNQQQDAVFNTLSAAASPASFYNAQTMPFASNRRSIFSEIAAGAGATSPISSFLPF